MPESHGKDILYMYVALPMYLYYLTKIVNYKLQSCSEKNALTYEGMIMYLCSAMYNLTRMMLTTKINMAVKVLVKAQMK